MTSTRKYRQLLKHTCTVAWPTEGSVDSGNQPTITWVTTTEDDVPCLLQNYQGQRVQSGAEQESVQMSVLTEDWVLFMLYRSDITPRCRISALVDDAGDSLRSGTFNVRLVVDPGGQHHHIEVHLESGVAAGIG